MQGENFEKITFLNHNLGIKFSLNVKNIQFFRDLERGEGTGPPLVRHCLYHVCLN